MIDIQVRHDRKRGCGWRQPGGTYLIAAGTFEGTGVRTVILVINKPSLTENHKAVVTAHEAASEGPTLAENEAEAMRMIAAGRSDVSLRESRVFDTERLADLPLFAQRGRLF